MNRALITASLQGKVTGRAWGGFDASLGVEVDLTGKNLVATVAAACKQGDFEHCKFSANSFVQVMVYRRSKVHPNTWMYRERAFPISHFPSLDPYIERT